MANSFFKDKYEVKLICKDDYFIGKGETVAEAIKNIKPPEQFKAFGTFQITYGGKTSVPAIRLNTLRLKRLFARSVDLEIMAKRLEVLM